MTKSRGPAIKTFHVRTSDFNGVSPGVPVVYLLFKTIKQWQVLYIHISESPKEKVMSDEENKTSFNQDHIIRTL